MDKGRQLICITLLFYEQPYKRRIEEKNDRDLLRMHYFSDNKPKTCRPSQNNNKKKCWFSNLEILEIHQKINNEQHGNTVPDTSRINKQKQPN